MSIVDEITKLQTALSALQTDQPKATSDFQRILLEANATQSILMVAGVVSGVAGATIGLPVTLIPGKFGPSGIQADFVLPTGMTFVSATLGPIPVGENKSIQTSVVGSAIRVIVFGLNQTVISEGLDFTLNLKSTLKGQFSIILQNPAASDPLGNSLPLCVTSGIVNVQ